MAKLPLILTNHEVHYSLHMLAALLPDKPNYKTVFNWCTVGIDRGTNYGCCLMEFIEGTNGMRSSVEAYHRFINNLNRG